MNRPLLHASLSMLFGLALLSGCATTPTPTAPKATEAAPAAAAPAATSPNEVIARVNGEPIARAEMLRAYKILTSQNRLPKELTPELKKQADEAIMNQLVGAELIYQAAAKSTIPDLDKKVAEKIAQAKERFPSNTEFQKALADNNMTEKELEEYTRRDLIIGNYVDTQIASKVTVSDEEIQKFYNENADKFRTEEQVRASHILCGVDAKATDEEKKKAKEKAEALLKRVKAGEDFAALAKDNSTCPSKTQGGDLGFFGKGQMVPAFESAAFSLKSGDVSGIVETQFGYHIIKVTEKKEAGTTKLDEVKDRIRDYLKNQKVQKAITEHVAELKTKAKVEILAN